jgi:hypothetical protein
MLRYHTEGHTTIWETENWDVALVKYRQLLEKFPISAVTVVALPKIDITISSPPPILVNFPVSVIVNNGTTFNVKFEPPPGYVIVDYDLEKIGELGQELTDMGATNISYGLQGIMADNPSGIPFTGALAIQEGMLVLYNQATSQLGYANSAIIFTL